MTGEDDRLLRALADLGTEEPDAARARAVLERASRTMARRRLLAQNRVLIMAAAYGALVAPFAAGTLSVGYIAAAVVQAIIVMKVARAGIF